MKMLHNPRVAVALGCFGLISASTLMLGFAGQRTLEQRVSELEAKVASLEKAFQKATQSNEAAVDLDHKKQLCIAQLKRIENAKEQWAMVYRKGARDIPTARDLIEESSEGFLRSFPRCPLDGVYTIGSMMKRPTCSLAEKYDHELY